MERLENELEMASAHRAYFLRQGAAGGTHTPRDTPRSPDADRLHGMQYFTIRELYMARVLVVDDDDIVLKALVSILRRLGHDAEGTLSALAALERVGRGLPDLLVLDYRLPDMDGVTLYRKVLALFGDESPPVLFVSGSPIEDIAAEVSPAARAAFLQKPFEFGELAREISALLAA